MEEWGRRRGHGSFSGKGDQSENGKGQESELGVQCWEHTSPANCLLMHRPSPPTPRNTAVELMRDGLQVAHCAACLCGSSEETWFVGKVLSWVCLLYTVSLGCGSFGLLAAFQVKIAHAPSGWERGASPEPGV